MNLTKDSAARRRKQMGKTEKQDHEDLEDMPLHPDSCQVQTNVILKDDFTLNRQLVYNAQAIVSNLFLLLCTSTVDNPELAKQYKKQIDSIIEEFSPFIFQERQ